MEVDSLSVLCTSSDGEDEHSISHTFCNLYSMCEFAASTWSESSDVQGRVASPQWRRVLLFAVIGLEFIANSNAISISKDTSSSLSSVAEWDYRNNGIDWKSGHCASSDALQSPIDLTKPFQEAESDSDRLYWTYKPLEVGWMWKTPTDLNISFSNKLGGFGIGSSFPPPRESSYRLMQMNFHTPSEHTWDGQRMPLELHLVHVGDTSETGINGLMNVAILAIPFETATHTTDPFLQTLLEIGFPEDQSIVDIPPSSPPINIHHLLEHEPNGFITYDGSFTQPPCQSGVRWFLKQTPVKASVRQVALLAEALGGGGGNYRNQQERHDRPLTVLPGVDARLMTGKTSISSDGVQKKSINQAPWVVKVNISDYVLAALPSADAAYPFTPGGSYGHTPQEGVPDILVNRIQWQENLQDFWGHPQHTSAAKTKTQAGAILKPLSVEPIQIAGYTQDSISLTVLHPMNQLTTFLGDKYESVLASSLSKAVNSSLRVVRVTPGVSMQFKILPRTSKTQLKASSIASLLTQPSETPTKLKEMIPSTVLSSGNQYLSFTDVTNKSKLSPGVSLSRDNLQSKKSTKIQKTALLELDNEMTVLLDADHQSLLRVVDIQGLGLKTNVLSAETLAMVSRMTNVDPKRFKVSSWSESTNIYLDQSKTSVKWMAVPPTETVVSKLKWVNLAAKNRQLMLQTLVQQLGDPQSPLRKSPLGPILDNARVVPFASN